MEIVKYCKPGFAFPESRLLNTNRHTIGTRCQRVGRERGTTALDQKEPPEEVPPAHAAPGPSQCSGFFPRCPVFARCLYLELLEAERGGL